MYNWPQTTNRILGPLRTDNVRMPNKHVRHVAKTSITATPVHLYDGLIVPRCPKQMFLSTYLRPPPCDTILPTRSLVRWRYSCLARVSASTSLRYYLDIYMPFAFLPVIWVMNGGPCTCGQDPNPHIYRHSISMFQPLHFP